MIMAKNYRAELTGCFGDPVDENPTGVMEEAAYAAKNLNFRYITLKVTSENLENAVKGALAFNFRGFNLTIPHKVAILRYMDRLTGAAEIIGAVNTVINEKGKLTGENTDGKGFIISLKNAGIDVQGRTLTVLGAGGAARAIGVECALAGAGKIIIINGNESRGGELSKLIAAKTKARSEYVKWAGTAAIPEDTDILVNATPVGLYPKVNEKPDILYDTITAKMIVTDVIFNDPHSLFLKEAENRGAKTINGLGMLINQGALNFKLWTSVEPPVNVMEETLRREFGL
jgi:shikimate dehydrogenase